MRAGTSTSIYRRAAGDPDRMDEKEIIRRLAGVGFQTLDVNLGAFHKPDSFMGMDDWQREIDGMAETAAKCGIVFSQVHLPYVLKGSRELDPRFRQPGFEEQFEEGMRRAYVAAGMLGAPWAVTHAESSPAGYCEKEQSIEANHKFFDRFVDLGKGLGVGTAFEIMPQAAAERPVVYRFTVDYNDLIDLVDSFHDPAVGICWDFGHANLSAYDQNTALRKVGSRLVCTHVNDNFKMKDDHVLPLFGSIKWVSLIPTLAEIGYQGDCSLEVGPSIGHATREIQDCLVKLSYETCVYLCKLFDRAKEAQAGQEGRE